MRKRSAKRQLTKDEMEISAEESDYEEQEEMDSPAKISERIISKPKSRLSDRPKVSAKSLFGNIALAPSIAPLSSVAAPSAPAPAPAPTSASESNPWVKLRGLNISFQKAVQNKLERDQFADLTKLFDQYIEFAKKLKVLHPELSLDIRSDVNEETNLKPSVPVEKPNEAKESFNTSKYNFSFTSTPKVETAAPSIPAKPEFTFQSAKVEAEEKKSTFSFNFTPSASPSTTEIKPFSFTFEAPTESQKPKEEEIQITKSLFTFENKIQPEAVSKPSFAFGNTPIETSFKPFSFTPQASGPGIKEPIFSFKPAAASNSQADESSQDTAAAGDEEPLEPSKITVIRTGAGEEGEECVAEARVKLFTFDKTNGWVDLGVGIFKVNCKKEELPEADSSRVNRVLCRAEASGMILLNSAVIQDVTKVEWTAGKKEFNLICFNKEAALTSFLVRTKEVSEAEKLVNAIRDMLR